MNLLEAAQAYVKALEGYIRASENFNRACLNKDTLPKESMNRVKRELRAAEQERFKAMLDYEGLRGKRSSAAPGAGR